MAAALILYGSRARGEAHSGSDVDLILAEDGTSLKTPRIAGGVSVHLYPKDWLEAEAESGSLFAFHVAHEGIALCDSSGFLERLRQAFRKKASYRDEIEVAALVLRMMLEKDWGSNLDARRRYFWALRTIIISSAADHGNFIFASSALEFEANIRNLAKHIDGRDRAAFEECRIFGNKVLENVSRLPSWHDQELRNYLLALGGIASDSVRVIEEQEAIEGQGLAIYL